MITGRLRSGDSLSSQMDRYFQQMSLDRLVQRYTSFLEQQRMHNSFANAAQFLQNIHITEAELKAMGVRSQQHLAITITNTSLPNWY